MKFMKDFFGSGGRETHSVILLRQVPIRFDEPARSWLGGLPQMPDDIDWPRTDEGAPLQFVAQVCCADLPAQMWAGLGPRSGWLLLFVDCYSMLDDGESYGGIVQVLHVEQLGPEREPPEDMGTFRHAMIDGIGSDKPVLRPGVPKMWRRWPVDVIVQDVPPPAEEDGDLTWRPLTVDATALYGAAVEDANLHGFIDVEQKPTTWRGALYLMDKLAHDLGSELWHQARKVWDIDDGVSKLLTWAPGLVARVLDREEAAMAVSIVQLKEVEAQAAEWRQQNPDGPADKWANWEALIQSKKKSQSYYQRVLLDLTAYRGPDGDEAFKAEIRRSEHAKLAWLNEQLQIIASLRDQILLQNLQAQLPNADWVAMQDQIAEPNVVAWETNFNTPYIVRSDVSLQSNVQNALEMARREDILDLYARDAEARAMFPPAMLAELEPMVRRIGFGQGPHRMGGPHDVVQESDEPNDWMLLFQIYSDGPMGWMWGDVGALFVQVRADDLKAGRFDRIEARMEGG